MQNLKSKNKIESMMLIKNLRLNVLPERLFMSFDEESIKKFVSFAINLTETDKKVYIK